LVLCPASLWYEKREGRREEERAHPFSSERLSSSQVVTTRQTVERAIQHISKELIWKLYFEAAQAEERAGNFDVCRAAYVEAVRNCPENLLWKVWLGAARTELNINNIVVARKLLQRSLDEVPPKNRALVVRRRDEKESKERRDTRKRKEEKKEKAKRRE
jgi:hypothetical protein